MVCLPCKRTPNFDRLKNVTFFFLILFTIVRCVLVFVRHKDECDTLFTSGRLDSQGIWRPAECMTHEYTAKDVRSCIENYPVRLLFFGEKQLFNLFSKFKNSLNAEETYFGSTTSKVLCFRKYRLDACFYQYAERPLSPVGTFKPSSWSRFAWTIKIALNTPYTQPLPASLALPYSPTHMILSLSPESVRNRTLLNSSLLEYQLRLSELSGFLKCSRGVRLLWLLQDSVDEARLPPRRRWLTNNLIEQYNRVAVEALSSIRNVCVITLDWLTKEAYRFHGNQNNSDVGTRKPRTPGSTSFSGRTDPTSRNDQTQMLGLFWNAFCNDHMRFSDASCCRTSDRLTSVQLQWFFLLGCCLICALLCFVISCCYGDIRWKLILFRMLCAETKEQRDESGPSPDVEIKENQPAKLRQSRPTTMFAQFSQTMWWLSKFGLIMTYFFLCDRTSVFMRANKEFTPIHFTVPLILLLAVGIFFTEETTQTTFNNVDITREWKGWMQLFILLYHYFDGIRITSLYLCARLCVASYIFLSGFGHFWFFWKQPLRAYGTAQPGENIVVSTLRVYWNVLKRYLEVLFRLNFLLFSLCCLMNQNYVVNYFMVLITFWFTVVVIVMSAVPRVSDSTGRSDSTSQQLCTVDSSESTRRCRSVDIVMLSKLAILLVLIELLYQWPGFFRGFFYSRLLRRFFMLGDLSKTSPNSTTAELVEPAESFWWFRWSLDRYSALYGMLFAFFVSRCLPDTPVGCTKQSTVSKQSKEPVHSIRNVDTICSQNSIDFCSSRFCSVSQKIISAIGAVGLLGTVAYMFGYDNREQSLRIYPFACVIPILSYVMVRNCLPRARSRYSVFFAWIGDFALELYVAQGHIWLAADTNGNLVFIPGYPTINFIVVTWTFVCVCHELHQITAKLQTLLLPHRPRDLVWKVPVFGTLIAFLLSDCSGTYL